MRLLIALVVAAVAVPAAIPAPADARDRAGFTGSVHESGSVRIHRGGDFGRGDGGRGDGGRGDGGRGDFRRDDRGDDRNRGDVFLPYRDYQGDSLWRPESFNDWWHERPTRAYPAWMARNQQCERQYWSGGGWRC